MLLSSFCSLLSHSFQTYSFEFSVVSFICFTFNIHFAISEFLFGVKICFNFTAFTSEFSTGLTQPPALLRSAKMLRVFG